MKQKQYKPISVAEQAIVLFAVNNCYLDNIKVSSILDFEEKLLDFFRENYSDLLNEINLSGNYDKAIQASFVEILDRFSSNFVIE